MNDLRFLPALRLAMSSAALCLIASTWPLWTGSSSFPQIPFLESLCGVGTWADGVCLILILAGAVSTLVGAIVSLIDNGRNREQRALQISLRLETFGPWVFVMGLGLSVLLNQHRLQPWVWHFMLLAPMLAQRIYLWDVDLEFAPAMGVPKPSQPKAEDYHLIVLLTAAIYFGSAASKMDQEFFDTYGQQLIKALFGSIGVSTAFWSESVRQIAAMTLPLGELATSILIWVPRSRRIGLSLSILMHLLLLTVVGPLGLNHEPAVLIWNGYFIGQNVILWKYSQASWTELSNRVCPSSVQMSREEWATIEQRMRSGIVWKIMISLIPSVRVLTLALAMIIPLAHLLDLIDPWPAWAVYASRPARVTVLVDEQAALQLPEELRKHLRARQLNDGRVFFRVDRWSIEATGAPIYPGDRFPFAVARAFSERPEIAGQVDIVVESAAGLWTGERTSHEYHGQDEITVAARTFRLNTRVRVRR